MNFWLRLEIQIFGRVSLNQKMHRPGKSRIIITKMTKQSDAKTVLQGVKPIYLLAAAGVSCIVCIRSLQLNNIEMGKLREDVYAADKNNGDVSGALTNLQHYVASHMNTNLTPKSNSVYPPIQLKYTYERLQAANASNSSNQQVYSDAQAYCEQQDSKDFSGRNRVPCIQQYVSTHGASVPKAIPDDLYKFDFVSAKWSPDLAGWTVVSTIALLLAAIVLFVVRRVVASKRRHHK